MLISTIVLDQLKGKFIRWFTYYVQFRYPIKNARTNNEQQEDGLMEMKNIPVLVMKEKIRNQILLNKEMQPREDDVVSEYMDIAMQFGLIILFSNVIPLTSAFCFLANFLKFKSMNNEFKYIRREEPELSFGIGKFIGIFEFMTQMSILMNVSIGYFTSKRFKELFLENYKWND